MRIRSTFRWKCVSCGLIFATRRGFTNHFLIKHLSEHFKLYEAKENG